MRCARQGRAAAKRFAKCRGGGIAASTKAGLVTGLPDTFDSNLNGL
jgi:hypothetical protein